MKKIVRKKLSDSSVTPARERRLMTLAQIPDRDISMSDIPALTGKFWQNAVPNPFYRPLKRQLTLRVDADVIAWLRQRGKGYQTRANAILRTAMIGDLNGNSKNANRTTRRVNPASHFAVRARRAR